MQKLEKCRCCGFRGFVVSGKKKMSPDPLQSIFTGLSKKLSAEFDFLSSQFSHSPSKGSAREFILMELLRRHLPQKLAVGSGLIVSSDGQSSKQIDIVIYDALNTPIMYMADELQIFPIECVYAVIEVKSHLNSTELRKSVENIRSVKRMPKVAYVINDNPIKKTANLYGEELDHFPVIGLVFAYSSIKNTQILKNKLIDLDDNEVINNIDTICILNKALITNWQVEVDKYIVTKEPDSQRAIIVGENSLLTFYLFMMHVLPQVWMYPIRMSAYAQHVDHGIREL